MIEFIYPKVGDTVRFYGMDEGEGKVIKIRWDSSEQEIYDVEMPNGETYVARKEELQIVL